MKKLEISQDKMMEILDWCYDKSLDGLPKAKSCIELADEYLDKYGSLEKASDKFIDYQIAKCSASGFITGLGGIITLPVAIPTNISSVLFVQLRMIATIAAMGGYDVKSDEVKTMVYLCLVGSSITNICKATGIQIANKSTTELLKKLPGTLITKINKAIGFRLITKFGEKGSINLIKVVPVAGGLLNGAVDLLGTKIIANRAIKVFVENELD